MKWLTMLFVMAAVVMAATIPAFAQDDDRIDGQPKADQVGQTSQLVAPPDQSTQSTETLKGDKGDTGEKGDPGATGPAGQPGHEGKMGPAGPTGHPGRQGRTGPRGRDGKNGHDGRNGRDAVVNYDAIVGHVMELLEKKWENPNNLPKPLKDDHTLLQVVGTTAIAALYWNWIIGIAMIIFVVVFVVHIKRGW
ncbi:MAG: hypothetical protein WC773_00785 [Patescibacteria group bacterium]|jgi:hypothetical protein